MKVDWSSKVAGVPLVEVQGMARKMGHRCWDEWNMRQHFGLKGDALNAVLEGLVTAGYLVQEDGRIRVWQATRLALRLAAVVRKARLSRGRMLRHLACVLARTEILRQDEAYVYEVDHLGLFGSAGDPDAVDCGDLDLTIKLRCKLFASEFTPYELDAYTREHLTGGPLDYWVDIGRVHALRLLRARNPYVTLHELEPIERLGVVVTPLVEAGVLQQHAVDALLEPTGGAANPSRRHAVQSSAGA